MRSLPVALSALLLVAACSPATEPAGDDGEEVRVLGDIAFYSAGDPYVEVPASAERGVEFPVVVRTYGGGCHRVGDTEVRAVGPAVVEVAPFDLTRLRAPCTEQLVVLTHTARVRFDAAGRALVRVRGREAPGGGELVVEREVLVR